jgi:hypothetical protein
MWDIRLPISCRNFPPRPSSQRSRIPATSICSFKIFPMAIASWRSRRLPGPSTSRYSFNHRRWPRIRVGRAVQRPIGQHSSEKINTVSIPKLIELSGQERISVLKIDIERAERELFSACVDEWLDRIDTSSSSFTGRNVPSCSLMRCAIRK